MKLGQSAKKRKKRRHQHHHLISTAILFISKFSMDPFLLVLSSHEPFLYFVLISFLVDEDTFHLLGKIVGIVFDWNFCRG